ncbi:hypothetical protein DFQ26_003745 [Actinomortierella ambigua]|nr:hypothetical protein DFQ26_003745 [Actinomortierella ambigua]
MPLDNFASTTVSASHDSNVIAVCLAQDQSTNTSKCYVYTTYNCARKLAGACGSGACERTCRVGGADEHASFVREMMYYSTPSSSCGLPSGPNTTPASTQAKTGSEEDDATTIVEDDAQESKPLNKYTKTTTTTSTMMMMSNHLGSETTEKVNPMTTTTTTAAISQNALPVEVLTTLTITSNDDKKNVWYGFIADDALFLRGDGWGDMEIRESIVAVLELAEEQLGCEKVYLCLEKGHPDLADLVRALMYADFQMVHPSVLPNADPKYLVLGI